MKGGFFSFQANGEALQPVDLHALSTHTMETKLAKSSKQKKNKNVISLKITLIAKCELITFRYDINI